MARSADDGMGQAFLKNHMNESQVGPKLGPTFGPKKMLTRGELNDRIMNEDAGKWRGVTEDPNY